MKRLLVCVVIILGFSSILSAQEPYRLPPTRVTEILDKAPTPIISINPRGGSVLLMDLLHLPDIKFLSQPILRLAGLRILPRLSMEQKFVFASRITVKSIDGGCGNRVENSRRR